MVSLHETIMKRARWIIVLPAIVLAPSAVRAQFTPSECTAMKATALANPTRRDTLFKVGFCNGFGRVYAELIGRYSLASDTSTYGAVFDYATAIRDPDVFTAAKSAAADVAAPTFARVGALVLLTNYSSDYGTLLERTDVMTSDSSFGCYPPMPSSEGGVSGGEGTMPSDFIAQSLILSRRILNDSSAPNAVRAAAGCLHAIALGSDSLQPSSTFNPSFIPPQDFRLLSACPARYLFRNLTPITVAVYVTDTYTHVGEWISLPPRPSGGKYSESPMGSTHGISVLYQGAVIAAAKPKMSC